MNWPVREVIDQRGYFIHDSGSEKVHEYPM